MSISSKGKGKSGGAQVITYFHIVESSVFLLSIFDKSEKENILNAEIVELIKEIDE